MVHYLSPQREVGAEDQQRTRRGPLVGGELESSFIDPPQLRGADDFLLLIGKAIWMFHVHLGLLSNCLNY